MKTINFNCLENNTVNNVADNKVSPKFVSELKRAFRMFPPRADMRYKQSPDGRLIISVTVTYESGMTQHFEGAGDTDLISAILLAMGRILNDLCDYKAEEHEVETANESENLVMEIFKQYISSHMGGYIESDWYNNKGERYRCIKFTPSFNKNVKFCLKATDEVNDLFNEICKPEWMKRAEAEQKAKQEVPEQKESGVA